MNKIIPRSFGTHDGTFHADEVTACALLWLFDCIDIDKVMRNRSLEKLETCEYICDVGGIYDAKRKWFDHHQADYRGALSSAGMVLAYLKEIQKVSSKEYHFLNESIIAGVDAHDNGLLNDLPGVCTYSEVISSFIPVPTDINKVSLDDAFLDAVFFAKDLLARMLKRYHYTQSCRKIVAQAMAIGSECLIFDQNIPWQDPFFELGGVDHPALFVIMPSDRHWKLRGIPPNPEHPMQVRLPLPEDWAGLSEKELQKVTSIKGAIFCHKGRFISVWQTKEDALKALELVLKRKQAYQK